jgi:Leucine-rich repeat (LRR) protein
MRFFSLFFCFLFSISLTAQDEQDPFEKYGPPGFIYTNMKEALKEAKLAYKVKLEHQPIDIKTLPKLGKLTQVQVLQLTANGITEFPEEMKDLKNLVYFSCVSNDIRTVPNYFGTFTELSELQFHGARLDSLPYDIAYLGRLRSLEIQNNKADTFNFPNSIGYLPYLNSLLVYNTRMDTLPSSFSEFKRLKSLTIAMCGLKKIPKSISRINSLELLVLDKNQIHELPKSLFRLKNLKYLSLQQNKLTAIPDNICMLKNLQVLDIRGNVFSDYDLAVLKALLPKGCDIIY